MIKKGFTRPDGYLLMDVYLEIFRGMIGEDSQGRVALHQFSKLLRVRSDLFEVFNIGVQVANDSPLLFWESWWFILETILSNVVFR